MRATDIIRHRRRREQPSGRPGQRLLHLVAGAALLVLLGVTTALTAGVVSSAVATLVLIRDLPDVAVLRMLPERFSPTTASTRLYALGEPGAGTRQLVLIDEITDPRAETGGWLRPAQLPAIVVAATVAAEDPEYFARGSPSLAQALREWMQTGSISRPLPPFVRELVDEYLSAPSQETASGAWRELRNWFLGWQVTRAFSREEIVGYILNTRYYGNLAYGIEAAARVYFDKPAVDLTPAEAALLAAVGVDPARNPFDDPEAALSGELAVLAAMRSRGQIDQGIARDAALPPLAAPPGSDAAASHFARLARRELERLLGPQRLVRGGLQVETTLDLDLQQQANCALDVYLAEPGVSQPGTSSGGGPPCPAGALLAGSRSPAGAALRSEAAMIALDPANGAIQALVGPADNSLSLPARPLGSLVRPFIYLTALSQGHSAASLLMDVESIYLQDGLPYSPRNADGRYLGPLRLREALASNRAVPAAQVLSWVGVNRVLDNARALGLEPAKPFVDGLEFGDAGFSANLLDVSRAFATIDHDGVLAGVANGETIDSTAIRRIATESGDALYELDTTTREILAPELAYLMTDILADDRARCVTSDCPEELALPSHRTAALAAGESPDSGDYWAIGYTPRQLIGVWLKANGNTSTSLTGADVAGPLWRALMDYRGPDGDETAGWRRPPGLRELEVCAVSGFLPRRAANGNAHCPTVHEWFIDGTQPTIQDDMLREVAVNRATGRLATIFTPPQLIERQTYVVFPPEAVAWAMSEGIPSLPAEFDTIRHVPRRSGDAAALVLEPWPVVSGRLPVIGTAGGDGFAYYRLAYFPGLLPESMHTIVERTATPVDAGELGVWDTTMVENGLHTLLLTVVRQNGTFAEVAIPVTVEN